MYNRVATGVAATPAAALLPQLSGAAQTVVLSAIGVAMALVVFTALWAKHAE